MDAFVLIVVFCLMFHPSIINGQGVQLSFNTSMYEGTADYYAHIGENVVLTCTVPSTETRVNMYKGTSRWNYETIVVNGNPVGDVTNQNEKYSFDSADGEYQLTIHNLDKHDRLNYWCRGCRYTDRCLGTDRRCCRWRKVYLDVKDTTDNSQVPDFCHLVSNTDGLFFTGNELILRCPKGSFELTAFNESFRFTVNFNITNKDLVCNLLTTERLTEQFNGTRLSCLNDENIKNYCRHLPNITLLNEITIKLSPERREIANGENVNFTCHSYPFLPFTIEWNILDNNVIFGNVLESEISHGSLIFINNVEFLNFTSSSLTVICNVTIGSENSFEMASVYLGMEDVATTHMTSLVSEINSTQITVGATMTAESDKFISPVSIVVPITVVIFILGIIIFGLVYMKARKPVTSKEVDRQNANINQGVGNVEENAYYTKNNEKTELGLTIHDSDLVDNVAYVSYDEGSQKG